MGCLGFTSSQEMKEEPKCNEDSISEISVDLIRSTSSVIKENPFTYYEASKLETLNGSVQRVTHKKRKFIRAIKIIGINNVTNLDDHNSLINAIKALEHPNINKIHEVYEFENKQFIISDFCFGGDLSTYIMRKGKLREREVALIMKQVFSAIDYYNGFGIVHNNLNLKTVLIENNYSDKGNESLSLKLINFKLTEFTSIGSKSQKIQENRLFNSPEYFDGVSSINSDIWAAGVIMYYLLEGSWPFKSESDEDLKNKIVNLKFSFSTEVSELAQNLLSQIFKPISKRCSSSQILSHQFIIVNSRATAESRSSIQLIKIGTALHNIVDYKVEKKLQQIFLGFIIHAMSETEHIKELKELFIEFDSSGDGRLTIEELRASFERMMSKEEAEAEVSRIITYLDTDSSGYVEMDEFIRASADMKVLLTQENLKSVFNTIDINKNGKITSSEIGEALSRQSEIDIDNCKKMLQEAELSESKEFTFTEFKDLMLKILESYS